MKYAETKRLIPDPVTAPNVHKYLNYVLNATAIQKYSMADTASVYEKIMNANEVSDR